MKVVIGFSNRTEIELEIDRGEYNGILSYCDRNSDDSDFVTFEISTGEEVTFRPKDAVYIKLQ